MTNTNEDAISRQTVLDITWEEPSYTDPLNVLTEIRDKIKDLPSVNPQKSGKWIEHGFLGDIWFECDQCSSDSDSSYNYCPNCGAKMIENEESYGSN